METTIRPATLNDLEPCRRMDGTVVSEHVWNMQQSSQRIDVSLLFSQVRLPRPLEVPYPSTRDDLVSRLEGGHVVLVAEQDQIVGWVALSYDDGIDVATVNHLIVVPERRRQGIGTQLMRSAVEGARRLRARVVMVPCLAKSGRPLPSCGTSALSSAAIASTSSPITRSPCSSRIASDAGIPRSRRPYRHRLLVSLEGALASAVLLTSFALMMYVLTHNVYSAVGRAFTALMAFVTAVYVGDVAVINSVGQEASAFWLRFQWLGIAFVPAAYLQLSLALLRSVNRRAPGGPATVAVGYAIGSGYWASLCSPTCWCRMASTPTAPRICGPARCSGCSPCTSLPPLCWAR